ncbi:carboxylesterase 3-like [Dermacentor albipictus]|uniref:carboxylesterase 3-like n=1 Tax=Dermacentor albipictus TaxID=60249 RepID=UPI0038FCD360
MGASSTQFNAPPAGSKECLMVAPTQEGATAAEGAQGAGLEASGSSQKQRGADEHSAAPAMVVPDAPEGDSDTPRDWQPTTAVAAEAALASANLDACSPSSTQALWVRQSWAQTANRTKVKLVAVAVLTVLALVVGAAVLVSIVVGTVHKTTTTPCHDSELDLLIETTLGTIRGMRVETADGSGARVFLGIPYAANVSGNRLFDLPSTVHRLVPTPFPAAHKGPACLQPLEFPLGQHQPSNVSEECLSLNVYTPSGCSIRRSGGEALPVLFFVTGWRLYTLNWNGMFDWHQLASRGRVIVVVPNYRVGVFGFLSRDHNSTSNMGVRDVLLAWQWTRTHIGAFGGDPGGVVPLGHSSGSIIISALLTRFRLLKCRRAILLSQSLFNLVDSSKETGLLRARAVGLQANCCAVHECPSLPVPDIVHCLSHLNGSHLLKTLGENFSLPTLDVTMEPFGLEPLQLPRDRSTFSNMQLLMGTNLHENDNLFRAWVVSQQLTGSTFRVVVERFLRYMRTGSDLFDWIMASIGSDLSEEEKFAKGLEISTKVIHHCMLTQYANSASHSGAEVRFFVLDEHWSAVKDRVRNHSSYGDDLYFVSGSVLDEAGITAAQRRLAEELMDNVAAFAGTGKPGPVKGVGEWPLRSVLNSEVVILSSNGSRVERYWHKQWCASFMNFYARQV